MFKRILIANRGEIALRVIRAAKSLGIETVCVYSAADKGGPWLEQADQAVCIGPGPSPQSYLRIDRIIAAALSTGAEAIHPGYGFLSENVDFAAACAAAGIVFIGPPVSAMEAMADKIRAKRTAIDAGVPVVPGSHDAGMDDAAVVAAVESVGFPALLKPSAGGGGKGMRIITSADGLAEQIASARREAKASFGDDTLLVERYISTPRHIEVQILADTHGTVLHLGERECSLQRRHQKVIEEAPSPLLDEQTRTAICESAVRLAAAVGYVGAGTVEYVVPSANPADFAFLEMNTRLQVEHPVTEMITGVDLVEQQVRISAGERLSMAQADIALRGHAIEARIYAEDPERGFLPTGGEITYWEACGEPAQGVRTDSGVESGSMVGSTYDPMLAKVIAWGPDRGEALGRLDSALARTICLGITTNTSFLRAVIADPDVRAGRLDTGLLARLDAEVTPDLTPALVTAACIAAAPASATAATPWSGSWRVSGAAAMTSDLALAGHTHAITVRRAGDGTDSAVTTVELDGVTRTVRLGAAEGVATAQKVDVTVDGETATATIARSTAGVWVHLQRTGARLVTVSHPRDRRLRGAQGDGHGGGAWTARSPMPGAIVFTAAVGQQVAAGEAVVTVEAMKMEHTLRSPGPGVITRVNVAVGQQVRLDEDLVIVDIEAGGGRSARRPAEREGHDTGRGQGRAG